MLPYLPPDPVYFPPTRNALSEPNGLLAAGGSLTVEWLLAAYQRGIFPWFNTGEPILWWSPSPRMVLFPEALHMSRSLRKQLRRGDYRVSTNRDFVAVINACALPRSGGESTPHGTWITRDMIAAYTELHRAGYAHSIEVWRDEQLAGGLYGIALGRIFFGESMFSNRANASKIAIAHLASYLRQWGYRLIDCQVANPHLGSLGAVTLERVQFEDIITRFTGAAMDPRHWRVRDITLPRDHWSLARPTEV